MTGVRKGDWSCPGGGGGGGGDGGDGGGGPASSVTLLIYGQLEGCVCHPLLL